MTKKNKYQFSETLERMKQEVEEANEARDAMLIRVERLEIENKRRRLCNCRYCVRVRTLIKE
jgi:hypothetical protein